MKENLTIGFIGNPNCGKTTLFNAYTGANLKVANWPGVTVEKVEGAIRSHDLNIRLVDLPGTYSLTSYTMEETVSRQFILSDEVDVVINVVDASALERSLYLTLQLLELGKPVLLALNMMDIVEKRGMEIDLHRLPEMLGIPVVPVSARKRTGLNTLLHAAAHHKDTASPDSLIHHHKPSAHVHDHHAEYAMVYSDKIEDSIDQVISALKQSYPGLSNYRWHAIKLLEQDKEVSGKYPLNLQEILGTPKIPEPLETPGSTGNPGTTGNTGNPGTTGNTGNSGTTGSTDNPGTTGSTGNPETQGNTGNSGTTGSTDNSESTDKKDDRVQNSDSRNYDLPNYESQIINEKYDFIEEIIDEVFIHKQRQDAFTEKADRALTHRVFGIPIFLGIMAAVFFLTFTVGDWIKGYFENGIDWLSGFVAQGLTAMHTNDILQSLVVEGIIGGVGTIVTFLPNIFILFLALAFLEDSGYMARVAYVMEGLMSRLGLSGKAFIPMLLGFGCTVPAIMASRALESKRDRYKVMLVTPFMSCNARLTIYILFSEMFFGKHAMAASYSMYLIGIAAAIIVSIALHLIDREESANYLLIELPEYKMPDARTVGIYVWDKVKDYLGKAGTTIFLATLAIWVLLNFGPHGYSADMSLGFAAIIGKWMVPLFAPVGLGFWQIAVALIAGISAKEVVVSSCAVLFGIVNTNSEAGMAGFLDNLQGIGFGPLNAFCLMVFCLLYVPCAATLATIHKESGNWKWTGFVTLFQLVVAWAVTFVAYRIGLMVI